MKQIYLVNQTTAHTALSTILQEYRHIFTYRAIYNHVWDKPLIADGVIIEKLPVVKPTRGKEKSVY
jgi:hypothetical protein